MEGLQTIEEPKHKGAYRRRLRVHHARRLGGLKFYFIMSLRDVRIRIEVRVRVRVILGFIFILYIHLLR